MIMHKKFFIVFVLLGFVFCQAYAEESAPATLPTKETPVANEKTQQPKERLTTRTKEKIKESIVPEKFPDNTQFLDAIDYPELQVVPRATDRLIEEAQFEKDYGLFSHWTFWTSGAANLIAGTMLGGKTKSASPTAEEVTDVENATKFSQAVGVGTIAIGISLYAMQPYNAQLDHLKRFKISGRRGELFKERLAEEHLEKIAKYMTVLSYMTPFLNFATAINVYDKGDSNVRMYAGMAIATSILPLMFKSSYITNYEKHLEYKRKIYAPLVSNAWISSPKDGLIPAVAATWVF